MPEIEKGRIVNKVTVTKKKKKFTRRLVHLSWMMHWAVGSMAEITGSAE